MMTRRIALCFACSMLSASAFAEPLPILQPAWLDEPPTTIERAVSSFVGCVRGEIRSLPASLDPEAGAAEVVERCRGRLDRVDREASRVIARSRLSDTRKAVAVRELRARLDETKARIAERIRRRGLDRAD